MTRGAAEPFCKHEDRRNCVFSEKESKLHGNLLSFLHIGA